MDFLLPNEMGEMPMNIVLGERRKSRRASMQMIASTERGVLVTRLWYIREVDPYEKIVTGMTRDGTFLVENGKVQCGLRNFRFNQSLIAMLSNVEAMSAAGARLRRGIVRHGGAGDEGEGVQFYGSDEVLSNQQSAISTQ